MHRLNGGRTEVFDLGMYFFVTLEVNLRESHFGRPSSLLVLDKVLIMFISGVCSSRLGSLSFSCRSLCRSTLSSRGGRGFHWNDWLFLLDVGRWVHLLLLNLEVTQSMSFDFLKDLIVWLLEHSFDLVQALLHCFQVLHHHAKEIGLRVLIKCSCVKSILLDNLVEE